MTEREKIEKLFREIETYQKEVKQHRRTIDNWNKALDEIIPVIKNFIVNVFEISYVPISIGQVYWGGSLSTTLTITNIVNDIVIFKYDTEMYGDLSISQVDFENNILKGKIRYLDNSK